MSISKKDILIKKLLYQSKNRGYKETGLILGNFADKYLNKMDIHGLKEFAKILNQSDVDLYNQISGKDITHKKLRSKMMQQLIDFSKTD